MAQRSIRQVVTPSAPQTHAPGMTNRVLIKPGNWTDYDPFLVLVEDWMREPGGFPDHPHRGIETVTLVLDGELHHADNRGNSGVLGADDVQWMTAGKGIIHAELPNEDKTSHTLQLWLNLPAAAKMVESAYQDLLAGNALRVEEHGATIRLLSGAIEGVQAPAQTQTPVQYLDLRLEPGGRVDVPVPASHNGFVLVIEGEVRVGSDATAASPGQVLWLDYPRAPRGDGSLGSLRVTAAAVPARLLVVTGEPLGERVVAYGPFVMNSEEEIRQAYVDFHSGLFGGPTPAAQDLSRARN
ncbi:MAG: pirin family protein [Chloroflexi bacterium]|nr:pirin family protein [Chloroflexota bacterium]